MNAREASPAEEVLVVVGSGARSYREYLWDALAHRRSWLIDDDPPTWQLPYVAGHTVFPSVRRARLTDNTDRLVADVAEMAAQHRITGFLTFDELLVAATARLCEQFGTAGLAPQSAVSCRDKVRTRQLLTGAGLPQPQFRLAQDQAEAQLAAQAIGYPVVVKPRELGGSVGVLRADDGHCLDPAVAAAASLSAARGSSGVLIEELIEGPEISVDGMVQAGSYHAVLVARKQVGPPPSFEEIGHIVDPVDPLLTDPALMATLREAHHALGLRDGMTHTEVKLTIRGPVIIEVNGRLGGDFIPLLGRLATGIDLAEVAADVAQSRPARSEPEPRTTAGVRFLHPPTDSVLRRLTLPQPGRAPGLVRAERLTPDGAVLLLPPRGYLSRYAYLICEANDPAECGALLDGASAQVEAILEPVP
ncbi:MAG: ATP-grasp domain-containing protein [Actinobacteria bacterium]|nr:ATP-grasp domain-containing protein [Actinomycetota bacterium]